MKGPTAAQLRVLESIAGLTEAKGYPPSVRELGEDLGIASTTGVIEHLDALQLRGLVHREPGRPRTIVITAPGRAALDALRREVA